MSNETGDGAGPSGHSLPRHVERERKFLVEEGSWAPGADADWTLISQAYVFARDGYAVRVRREQRATDDEALLDVRNSVAVKGPRLADERTEYEYDLDPVMVQAILDRADHIVVKKRYPHISEDETWQIDVFEGLNDGLVMAELEGTGIRRVRRPWWASLEVTADDRYTNDYLALHPYSTWGA